MRNQMKSPILLLLIVLLSACALGQQQSRDLVLTRTTQPAGLPIYTGSHALIVGVNKYPNLPKEVQLRYAVNDAVGMKKTLVDYYGFPEENVTLLTDGDATKSAIEKALQDLSDKRRVGPDDRIIVFFSGHGQTVRAPDGRDRGFFIPTDAKVNLANPNDIAPFDATCLNMPEMLKVLFSSPAKHIAIIADSCFSGLLTTSRSLFEENPLAAFLTTSAHQAISAGTKGQKTWETDANRHGIFTFNLLAELQRRAKEKQQVFTLLDLFAAIQPKVVADSSQKQIPQFTQFLTEGQMLFFATGNKAAPEKPPVGDPNTSTNTSKPKIAKLSVKSRPDGAKVSVDGVDMGVTPMTQEIELEKNKKIRVRIELEGYEPIEKTFELKPNKETKVDEKLKKLKVPVTPKPATLTIVTSPAGATVSVDGEAIGTSPIEKKIELNDTKTVSVKFELAGYEIAERSVELRSGKESKLSVTLVSEPEKPKRATLEVVSEPVGAEISIDGVVQGKSPVNFAMDLISPVSVSIKATLNGYQTIEQSAILDPNVPAKVILKLQRRNIPPPPITGALKVTKRSVLSYQGSVRRVQFSPDGTKVAVTSLEGHIKIYDASSGQLIQDIQEPLTSFVRISSDWKYLINFYMAKPQGVRTVTVMIQSLDNPKLVKVYSAAIGQAESLNYATAQNGSIVVCGLVGDGSATVAVIDIATGKSDAFQVSGLLQGATVSPDGSTIALFRDPRSFSQEANLMFLRGPTREDQQQVRLTDSNVGQQIVFAQSGEAVAVNAGRRISQTSQTQRGMKIIESRDGRMRFSSTKHVAIGFLAGGTRLLGWSEAQGGSIELFDAVSGASLGAQKSARPYLSDDGRLMVVPVPGGFELFAVDPIK